MNYVGYYRVSTEKQEKSGLGLSSQKQHVRHYVRSVNGNLVGEFTEVQSGGDVDRKILKEAIELALQHSAIIVVKRLDRLSRDGFHISNKLESLGLSYIDCESPNDTGLVKNIKLAVAKEDKEKIGARIGDALNQIKKNIEENGHHITKAGKKITSLGNKENLNNEMAIKNSVATRKAKALTNPNNIRAKAVIDLMKGYGETTYAVVKFLNSNGFRTSRGNEFSQTSVKKLYLRDKE